jgi:hypothetical protein
MTATWRWGLVRKGSVAAIDTLVKMHTGWFVPRRSLYHITDVCDVLLWTQVAAELDGKPHRSLQSARARVVETDEGRDRVRHSSSRDCRD